MTLSIIPDMVPLPDKYGWSETISHT